jgi:hypothetical protein
MDSLEIALIFAVFVGIGVLVAAGIGFAFSFSEQLQEKAEDIVNKMIENDDPSGVLARWLL